MSIIAQATLSISYNDKYAARDRNPTRKCSRYRVVNTIRGNALMHAGSSLIAGLFVLLGSMVSPSHAAVGDAVAAITPTPSGSQRFCAIGLAFDGTDLYVNRCSDPNIYAISAQDGSLQETRSLIEPDPLNPKIAEWPAAMAFDAKRNGLWFGTQNGSDVSGFGSMPFLVEIANCSSPGKIAADLTIRPSCVILTMSRMRCWFCAQPLEGLLCRRICSDNSSARHPTKALGLAPGRWSVSGTVGEHPYQQERRKLL